MLELGRARADVSGQENWTQLTGLRRKRGTATVRLEEEAAVAWLWSGTPRAAASTSAASTRAGVECSLLEAIVQDRSVRAATMIQSRMGSSSIVI